MTARLGISIRRDDCAVILMRRGRVRWHRRVARDAGQDVRHALAELLAGAPKRRSDVRVVVAVGVSYAQIRRIGGVPSTMRADVASRLVQENVASFFLRSSARLVVTRVQRGVDGAVWGAALDGTIIDEVLGALRDARFASAAFLPEPVAAAAVLAPGTHRVIDGDVVAEYTSTDGKAIQHFPRVRGESPGLPGPLANLPLSIHSLGQEGRHYVAAFGATTCSPNHPFAWRPPANSRRVRLMERLRFAAAAALLMLSIVAALLAPSIRGSLEAGHSMRLAARREPVRGAAVRVEGELRSVTASLDRLDRFVSDRDGVALVLAELARALPDSTALLTVRIDSVEVNLSVLTPRAADVILGFSQTERVASPRILGSVVRDVSKREPLERATVRLRRRPPATRQ